MFYQASKRERQHAKQVQESKKSAKVWERVDFFGRDFQQKSQHRCQDKKNLEVSLQMLQLWSFMKVRYIFISTALFEFEVKSWEDLGSVVIGF